MPRLVVMLFAILSLFLAAVPGADARGWDGGYAMGPQMVSADLSGADCGASPSTHDQGSQHGVPSGHKMCCCVAATCVSAWLPAVTSPTMRYTDTAIVASVTVSILTGRDVAPLLDPPQRAS